jgi:hypothetical protein
VYDTVAGYTGFDWDAIDYKLQNIVGATQV